MDITNKEAELMLQKKELALINKKKDKYTAELMIFYKELAFQNEEKEKCTSNLITAYKELACEKEEKEKRAAELIAATEEIEKAVQQQKEYIEGLEKMMFMTSHKLRSPIANILGVINHLEDITISDEEVEEMKGFLKQLALSLDHSTREMTTFIYNEKSRFEENEK